MKSTVREVDVEAQRGGNNPAQGNALGNALGPSHNNDKP